MLNDTIINGINNPDCAYFVGMTVGSASLFGKLFLLMAVFTLFKFVEKLAVEPIIAKIKNKIKGVRK